MKSLSGPEKIVKGPVNDNCFNTGDLLEGEEQLLS